MTKILIWPNKGQFKNHCTCVFEGNPSNTEMGEEVISDNQGFCKTKKTQSSMHNDTHVQTNTNE